VKTYYALLAKNFDHFGDDAVKAWTAGHLLAIQVAINGYNDPANGDSYLNQAYAINAFADHFLTDLFSAGHLRVPDDVWNAFRTGSAPASYAALDIIPDLKRARDHKDKNNKPALFILKDDGVHVRTPLNELVYKWKANWIPALVYARYKQSNLAPVTQAASWPLQSQLVRFSPNGKFLSVEMYKGLYGADVSQQSQFNFRIGWPEATPVCVAVGARQDGASAYLCMDTGRSNGKIHRTMAFPHETGGYTITEAWEIQQSSTANDLWVVIDGDGEGVGFRQALAQLTPVRGVTTVRLWKPTEFDLHPASDTPLPQVPWPPFAVLPWSSNDLGEVDLLVVARPVSNEYALYRLTPQEAGFSIASAGAFPTPSQQVLCAAGNLMGLGTDTFAYLKVYLDTSTAILTAFRPGDSSLTIPVNDVVLFFCLDINADGIDEVVVVSSEEGTASTQFQVLQLDSAGWTTLATSVIAEGIGATQWIVANKSNAGAAMLLQFWNSGSTQSLAMYGWDPSQNDGAGGVVQVGSARIGESVANSIWVPVSLGTVPLGD
jgi:hypothetical protein